METSRRIRLNPSPRVWFVAGVPTGTTTGTSTAPFRARGLVEDARIVAGLRLNNEDALPEDARRRDQIGHRDRL